ncbi:DUF6362 family protein [Kiloniella laminariae]|uniref:DUF6362 family protein n=1 Tax=Kiloniella laminariae TaxID=454162 RepID=UPI0003824E87|nr:DUF6362 family protein [Kiloniella laminariae]
MQWEELKPLEKPQARPFYVRGRIEDRAEVLDGVWSPDLVERVLASAIAALMSQGLSSRDVPSGAKSSMPQVVRSITDLIDAVDDEPYRQRPSARQLKQAEEAFPWMMMIAPEKNRRILFMRMLGFSWKKIKGVDGRSRQHLSGVVYANALHTISVRLDREEKIFPAGFTDLTKFDSYL